MDFGSIFFPAVGSQPPIPQPNSYHVPLRHSPHLGQGRRCNLRHVLPLGLLVQLYSGEETSALAVSESSVAEAATSSNSFNRHALPYISRMKNHRCEGWVKQWRSNLTCIALPIADCPISLHSRLLFHNLAHVATTHSILPSKWTMDTSTASSTAKWAKSFGEPAHNTSWGSLAALL